MEQDVIYLFGKKIQDKDLREKFQQYSSETNIKITDIMNIVDPLKVKLNCNQNIVELGKTVSAELTWSSNKVIESQKINNEIISPEIRNKVYRSLDKTTIFELDVVSDSGDKTSTSIGVYFYNAIYCGSSALKDYDSNFINSLERKILTNTKKQTFETIANTGQYIYFCAPARFNEYKFSINGFEGCFEKVDTIKYKNTQGYEESYNIYKSVQKNLGKTTVNAF